MITQLSDEQQRALLLSPEGIEVRDQDTQKVYVFSDADLHRRAMQALKRQQERDSIQAGIDDMEAGRVLPIEQADQQIRDSWDSAPLHDIPCGDLADSPKAVD